MINLRFAMKMINMLPVLKYPRVDRKGQFYVIAILSRPLLSNAHGNLCRLFSLYILLIVYRNCF